jgi:hypothetical protein
MMAAVLAVLLAAGCTSSPEKVGCPISPEKEASNQSAVTAPIKETQEYAQKPCVEINSSQNEDRGGGI